MWYAPVRKHCPTCGDVMNIVWLEFLPLDRCDAHGVWLDTGELERALRWEVEPNIVPPSAAVPNGRYQEGKVWCWAEFRFKDRKE
jgi:Zn-finger nucleic acid-binding protein